MPPVRVLSFHAGYGCRQRGVCCAAGWPVPVEPDCAEGLASSIGTGRLLPRARSRGLDWPSEGPPETPALLSRPDGRCAFFDQDRAPAASCRIHATLGHGALPLACRQFPRVSVQDPRGVSVTLSHYCPTAAGSLDNEEAVTVLDAPPGFPSDGEYVGLDAREGVPPLLRPDMAMDWESWWRWERGSVELLTRDHPTNHALALLRGAVEALRSWRPSDGPLIDRVDRALVSPTGLPEAVNDSWLVAGVLDAVPPGLQPETSAGAPPGSDAGARVRRRFLVAHAFANWTAHLGHDLRAWLRSIEAAHALLVTGRTVADADLLLRHLADPNRLARTWSRAARD